MAMHRSAAKTRPRKIQDRAQRTRDAILATAMHEFAQSGFAGARIDLIARRAGVNKQALYYYFGSKEKLFQAALASTYEQFQVDAPSGNHPISPRPRQWRSSSARCSITCATRRTEPR
jgi:AcrR family transcriptional regulator